MNNQIPLAVFALWFATACTDSMSSRQTPPGDPPRQYPVVVESSSFETLSATERTTLKQQAIAAILERTPLPDREALRILLEESPDRETYFVTSQDPEVARHLGALQSIRAAEAKTRRDALDARPVTAADRVTVLVALTNDLPDGVRVRVVRNPDDGGIATILVREEGATANDIAIGLRLAGTAYKKLGTKPAKRFKSDFAPNSGRQSQPIPRGSPLWGLLDDLKRAAPDEVEGFGPLKALHYYTTAGKRRPRR